MGGADLIAAGGVRLMCYYANGGGGGYRQRSATRKLMDQAKCNAKDGIFRHENIKDLGIPNSLLFLVGTY